VTPERRRRGRAIRKMRRQGRKLRTGYLFVAPLGQARPEGWITLGATEEGFRWRDGWAEMGECDSMVLGPIAGESFEVTVNFPIPDSWR
jgi:hypothetical protein